MLIESSVATMEPLSLTQHLASVHFNSTLHEARSFLSRIHTLLAVLPHILALKHECACVVRDVLKQGAAFFELGLPLAIRRSAACVQPSISSGESVPPLPAMIGLHATLYPELDVRTGASPSLRRSLR